MRHKAATDNEQAARIRYRNLAVGAVRGAMLKRLYDRLIEIAAGPNALWAEGDGNRRRWIQAPSDHRARGHKRRP
jgi:hypothetical protein